MIQITDIKISRKDRASISKYKWNLSGNGYIHTYFKGRYILLHRFITKPTKKQRVDHRDGNKLNNLRSNLRKCSHRQNLWNHKKYNKNCSSKFRGVHWYKPYKKWMARIHPNGKEVFLGYFEKEIDAAKAYDVAAKKYYKKFANLNI